MFSIFGASLENRKYRKGYPVSEQWYDRRNGVMPISSYKPFLGQTLLTLN